MTTRDPKVSILSPIYGVERFIERCAKSLFEQTYQNIEYVFVDDCSKDRSVDLLLNVIEKYPNRKPFTRIIKHECNRGLAAARNTAIDNASGEFICHVDSDDWVERDMIELMVKKQAEKDSDIVSVDAIVYFKNKTDKYTSARTSDPTELAKLILTGKARTQVWARLIRRSIYIDYKIFAKEGVNMSEDFQVMPILAYYAKKVDWVDKTLYHYDCMNNESSYTLHYTEKNLKQSLESSNLVVSFFSDKPDFRDINSHAEIVRLLKLLKRATTENLTGMIPVVRREVKRALDNYSGHIPLEYKMFYILKYQSLCKLYYRIASVFKKTINKFR